MKAKLTINCGSMFSGKSTELIRQGERHLLAGHSVVFIKPKIDTRYSEDKIVNHKGIYINAIAIKNPIKLITDKAIRRNEVILIDEVQFFDQTIVRVILYLLKKGYVIYCSGLDMDFKGEPFNIVAQLMAMADEVNKFRAVCEKCGEDANFSYRKTKSNSLIALGGKDEYMPLCRKCFYEMEGKQK